MDRVKPLIKIPMKNHLPILSIGSLALLVATMASCEKNTDEPIEYPPTEYTISVTAGTGGNAKAIIDGTAATKAAEGAQVTFSATPDEGYTFDRWVVESGDAELSGAQDNPAQCTMPARDVSVKAEFAEITVELNVFDEIADPGFLYYCRDLMDFDANGDGRLSPEEARLIREINVSEWYKVTGNRIYSLEGIEYFTGLTFLACYGNALTELDLSKNTELTYLHVGTNLLTKLDLSNNTKLVELYVGKNMITEIDLSPCPGLKKFHCFVCSELTSVDFSKNPELVEVYAESCPKITSLDFSNNPDLAVVRCYDGNLTSLDVSNCTKIEALNCFDNQLTELDVSRFTELTVLDCSGNRLTALDVSNAASLEYLMCYNNRMTELDASTMAKPDEFYLSCGIQTSDGTTPQTLTLTLREDQKPRWQYAMLGFDNNAGVELAGESADIFLLMDDPVFKAYCEQFDTDRDGKLSQEEASAVTEIDVAGMGITSLVGVNYFAGLKRLVCNNNELTSLHAYNPEMTELVCNDNQLTELVVNKGIESGQSLVTLSCQNNQLPELSVAGLGSLKTLNCQNNRITRLNTNWAKSLSSINCSNNKLTDLNFYQIDGLVSLTCPNNELTELNLSGKTQLMSLMCNNNPMTSLDISGCTALMGVMAYENRLSALDASDMTASFNLFIGNQTSDGTTAQTLTLTLREEQKQYWEDAMKDSPLNNNVVLAD